MADNSGIDPEIVRSLEESLRSEKITADQFAIAMDRLRKQTMDVTARLVELGKKGREEADAKKLSLKALKDEKEALERSSKTRAEKDAEWALLQAKVMSGMHDATDEQKKNVEAQFQQTAALVKTEQRQKIFNDSLATTKSYLLPLGAAAGDVAKSLASSIKGNPLEASAAMATKYAEKAGQGLSAAGTAAGGLGQELMKGGTKSKIFGGLLQAGGLAAQGLGGAAKVAGEAISTITPIISGFQATYKKAGEAGATFGGGMTELRDIAGRAGMKMDDLVGGVEKGQEAFSRGGLNFQQASKFVGNMGKSLVEGKAATDLFALGFTDVGDRVALAAGAFDQARAKGMSLGDAQKNITDLTVNYAKDLKVLQGFVGKSAEKELEKGRIEAQGAALRQKLQGDQLVAFEQTYAVLSKLPGEQGQIAQKALMQMVESGTTNIAEIRSNPAMMKALTAMAEDVKNGTQKAGDAAIENLTSAAKEARETSGAMAGADRARLFGVDGVANNISTFNNALMTLKFDPETAKQNRDAVNNLTTNIDATTANMDKINQAGTKVQVALEQIATSTGAIDLFGKAMGEANKATQSLIDMINSATSGKSGSMMEAGAKGLMDVISSPNTWMAAAAMIGTEAATKIGAIVGKLPLGGGSTLGGAIGSGVSKVGGWLGSGWNAVKGGVSGLAGSVASAGARGAEELAGASGSLATAGGKTVLKKIPWLGGIISGAIEYAESGNMGKSLVKGAGSVIGGAIGTAGGAGLGLLTGGVASPVLGAAGAVAGSYAGEEAAGAIYDWVEGWFTKKAPEVPAVQATPTPGPQSQVQQPGQVVASIAKEDYGQTPEEIIKARKAAEAQPDQKSEDSGKLLLQAVQQQTQLFAEVLDALMDINKNTRNTVAALG